MELPLIRSTYLKFASQSNKKNPAPNKQKKKKSKCILKNSKVLSLVSQGTAVRLK